MSSTIHLHPLPNITNTNITDISDAFPNAVQLRTAWYTFMIIGGQVFLPIILLTMILSKNVRRGAALINYIIVSMEFSITSCLLFYAGVSNGPEPPFGICLAQAGFMYGAFPAINLAGFFVVFHVWRSLRAVTRGKELEVERMTRLWTICTIAAPHLMTIIFLVAAIANGSANPHRVTRDRDIFYCSIATHINIFSAALSALFSLSFVVMEVWTLVILYTKWNTDLKELPNTTLAFDIRLIKRIFVMTVLALFGFASAIFQDFNPKIGIVYHFSFCFLPLGAALVIGSQPSMLRVWCFWKPRKPRTEVDSYATSFAIVENGRKRSGTLLTINDSMSVTKFNLEKIV